MSIVLCLLSGTSYCQAATNINVGDVFFYSRRTEHSFSYNGETTQEIRTDSFYLDIQYVEADKVGLIHYWFSPYNTTYTIYSEENYNSYDMNFPGFFIDIDDMEFFYNAWKEKYDDEEITELITEDRKLGYTLFRENTSFSYGYDYTTFIPEMLVDFGNYTYSYEIMFTENGIRDTYRREYEFEGEIAKVHFKEETFLGKGSITINSNFYFSLIPIVIVVFYVFVEKRRRKNS